MNNSFEIMDMLGQAKQYIDKAYEMLKEENALESMMHMKQKENGCFLIR